MRAKISIKAKIYLVLVLSCLTLMMTACNGVGNLKITVYDSGDRLVNDVYVGLYEADFDERLDFKYTTRGTVEFKALQAGNYGIKLIKKGRVKKLQAQITGEETNYLEVKFTGGENR